jgi:catalytic LigB subunit of aromatic ring-opening dioxygenase
MPVVGAFRPAHQRKKAGEAMAEIVLGVASSHTPQLSSGFEFWTDHGKRDQGYSLLGRDAEYHTYAELLAEADPRIEKELEPQVWAAKYQRCQEAVETLSRRLADARVDVAVVIGDDQHEIFQHDGTPTFACFLGTELIDIPPGKERLERMPAGVRAASWAAHSDRPERHQVCAELSSLVIEALVAADFDPLSFTEQPAGRTLGHAFTFPRYRLGLSPETPITPVFINTYFPPNVPSARRCYELGRVVRDAVNSWTSDARVAIIASGGLSHFVIDEELDQRFLTALERGDSAALGGLPRALLRSGNSELLNWITAAGALEGRKFTLVDYVAGYRTPAGTGTGMAFVYWE